MDLMQIIIMNVFYTIKDADFLMDTVFMKYITKI